jgi:predicted AlkP superfamily phosphohydrolase/phosphomutase
MNSPSSAFGKDIPPACAVAALFFAFGLYHLSLSYDGSAFTYAIIAENGGFKFQQLLHPVYVPFLRLLKAAARAAGWQGSMMEIFQVASLAASALTVGLSWLLARLLGAGRWTSCALAAISAFWPGFLYYSAQTKPYAFASLAVIAFLCAVFSGLPARSKGVAMGLAVGVGMGFTLAVAALLPAGALACFFAPPPQRREQASGFSAALGSLLFILVLAGLVQGMGSLPDISWGDILAQAAPGVSLGERNAVSQVSFILQRFALASFELQISAVVLAAGLALGGASKSSETARTLLVLAAAALGFIGFLFFAGAGNHFGHVVFLPLPFALFIALRDWKPLPALLTFVAVATALHGWLAVLRPGSRGEGETSIVEGEFLHRLLRSGDMVLSAGPIDWKLLYRYGDALPLHAVAIPGISRDPFGRTLVQPGAPMEGLVRRTLERGGRVFLAADSFYRTSLMTEEEWVQRIDLVLEGLRGFRRGVAVISPAGQHYYPITLGPLPKPAGPVFLIGIDGAAWDLIDPLLAKGKLPNLAALMASGCHAALKSDDPSLNSAVLWTSIATGKVSAKHGIQAWDPALGIPPSTNRKTKAVWNILSGFGAKVLLSNYMGTWPAEKVNGVNISRRWRGEWMVGKSLQPVDAFAPIEESSARTAITDWPRLNPPSSEASNFIAAADEMRVGMLANALSNDEIAVRAAEFFLARASFDFLAVHLWGLDWVSHMYLESGSKASARRRIVEAYYERADAMVGRLRSFDKSATVLVVSDHGFRPNAPGLRRKHGLWKRPGDHTDTGIFIISGSRAARCRRRGRASTLDVTPTILHMMGYPVASDMDGQALTGFLRDDGDNSRPVKLIASYDEPEKKPEAAGFSIDRVTLDLLRQMGYMK